MCHKCFISSDMNSNQSDAWSVEWGDFCPARSTILVSCGASLCCAVSHSSQARALVSGSCKMAACFSGPVSDAEEVASISSGGSYRQLWQPLTAVFVSEMSGLLAERQLRTSSYSFYFVVLTFFMYLLAEKSAYLFISHLSAH